MSRFRVWILFEEKKIVSGCVPGLLGWRQIGLKIVFAKMAFVTFAKKMCILSPTDCIRNYKF
jgi:hypothetical protein